MKSSKPLAFTLAGLSIVALAALGVSREMQGKAVSPATGRAPEASALGLKQDKDTSAAGAPMQPRLPAKASPSSPRPGDPLSGAKTEADVAWLQRNGYPSAEAVQDALLRRGTRGPFNQKELQDPAAILDAEQLALLDPSRRSEALDFLAASAQSDRSMRWRPSRESTMKAPMASPILYADRRIAKRPKFAAAGLPDWSTAGPS